MNSRELARTSRIVSRFTGYAVRPGSRPWAADGAPKHVEGIMAMSHAELVAAAAPEPSFCLRLPPETCRPRSSTRRAPIRSARKYVEGFMAVSHAQLVAGTGTDRNGGLGSPGLCSRWIG